jgi:putative membrane protein
MTEHLPTLNAILNFSSAVMLLIGHSRIRSGDRAGHRRWMLRAVACSAAFLVSYLVFHYLHGSTKFTGEGLIRTAYFAILTSHTILAVVNVPLVGFGLYHALGERYDRHRRIVRWAYPVWLYVSVTGVVIYLLLYHLYAPA